MTKKSLIQSLKIWVEDRLFGYNAVKSADVFISDVK
jgi:hypothetical protein